MYRSAQVMAEETKAEGSTGAVEEGAMAGGTGLVDLVYNSFTYGRKTNSGGEEMMSLLRGDGDEEGRRRALTALCNTAKDVYIPGV